MRLLAAFAALLLAGRLRAQTIAPSAPAPAYSILLPAELEDVAAERLGRLPDAVADEETWSSALDDLRLTWDQGPRAALIEDLSEALCGSSAARRRLAAVGLPQALMAKLETKSSLVLARASRSPTLRSKVESLRDEPSPAPDAAAPEPEAVRLPERTLEEAAFLKAKPEDAVDDLAAVVEVMGNVKAFVELKGDLALPATLQRHLEKEWYGPSGNVNTVRTKLHLDAARAFAEAVRKDPELFGGVPNAVDYMLEGAKRATNVLGQTYVAEIRQAAEAARTSFREAILGLFAVDSPLMQPYTAPLRPFGGPITVPTGTGRRALRMSADFALIAGGSHAAFEVAAAFTNLFHGGWLAIGVPAGVLIAAAGAWGLGSALRTDRPDRKLLASILAFLVTLFVAASGGGAVITALAVACLYSLVLNLVPGLRFLERRREAAPMPPEEWHARIDPKIVAEIEETASLERRFEILEEKLNAAAIQEAAEAEAVENRRGKA